jgi:hypothetical protein
MTKEAMHGLASMPGFDRVRENEGVNAARQVSRIVIEPVQIQVPVVVLESHVSVCRAKPLYNVGRGWQLVVLVSMDVDEPL